MKKTPAYTRALDWATSNNTGLSSIALLRYWYFGEYKAGAWPYDYDDANRCAEFLKQVPEALNRFIMLCELSPMWDQWEDYILKKAGLHKKD